MALSTVQVLRKAKAILKKDGRSCHQLKNSLNGKCCLLGAIGEAKGYDVAAMENDPSVDPYERLEKLNAVKVLAAVIKENDDDDERFVGVRYSSSVVYRFNDALKGAVNDPVVFDMLDKAIAKAQETPNVA